MKKESNSVLESNIENLSNYQQKRALDMALETRKFEIDLYWRRTIYFWAFISLAFVAYFTIQQGAKGIPFIKDIKGGLCLLSTGMRLFLVCLCGQVVQK
jgi:hypothetical protein